MCVADCLGLNFTPMVSVDDTPSRDTIPLTKKGKRKKLKHIIIALHSSSVVDPNPNPK
jgi:hypothetical protein